MASLIKVYEKEKLDLTSALRAVKSSLGGKDQLSSNPLSHSYEYEGDSCLD
ncbi:hypothetical protein [Polynucleobacter sp. AP-Kaivos-20-H2]|uniref:hypothetical protein n=1 Tax=Polynucleobacter sp. AP-Kaivos-20-H2 TaxID=2689104 RepID=UPI001C0AFB98|nr:hypothetical protein [Polynucleobacter sp. AP-Kaivos-20-H2]MBU3604114.1 hypothetical protein [Polynucleobacter sp. AP-Kaivos-20-H2]